QEEAIEAITYVAEAFLSSRSIQLRFLAVEFMQEFSKYLASVRLTGAGPEGFWEEPSVLASMETTFKLVSLFRSGLSFSEYRELTQRLNDLLRYFDPTDVPNKYLPVLGGSEEMDIWRSRFGSAFDEDLSLPHHWEMLAELDRLKSHGTRE